MAAGAIRLVCGGRPLHNLGVVLVTFGARKVAAMIQRFVGQADVHVDVRNPGVCRVARIAFLLRDEMPEVLAGSDRAVVAR